MKTKILAVVLGVLLITVNLFAADGDLIVNGKLGVGTGSGSLSTPLKVVGSYNLDGYSQIIQASDSSNSTKSVLYKLNGSP